MELVDNFSNRFGILQRAIIDSMSPSTHKESFQKRVIKALKRIYNVTRGTILTADMYADREIPFIDFFWENNQDFDLLREEMEKKINGAVTNIVSPDVVELTSGPTELVNSTEQTIPTDNNHPGILSEVSILVDQEETDSLQRHDDFVLGQYEKLTEKNESEFEKMLILLMVNGTHGVFFNYTDDKLERYFYEKLEEHLRGSFDREVVHKFIMWVKSKYGPFIKRYLEEKYSDDIPF